MENTVTIYRGTAALSDGANALINGFPLTQADHALSVFPRANAAQMAALARQRQEQELAGAGALNQIGTQQQGLGQQNLDFARSEWERQQAYPQQQVSAMTGALQGVSGAVPKTVEEYGITPNAVPTSTTAQNIGAGITAGAGVLSALKDLGLKV